VAKAGDGNNLYCTAETVPFQLLSFHAALKPIL
jgi:hypothetical protein